MSNSFSCLASLLLPRFVERDHLNRILSSTLDFDAERQRRGIWKPGASAERREARRPWVRAC